MPDTPRPPAPQTTPLFRIEAVRFRSDAVSGATLSAAPVGFGIGATAAILFAAALIGLTVFGRYTQRETVAGYVAVTEGEVRVFPQTAGIIDRLMVAEGDHVATGMPMILLATARNSGMSTEANTEILAALIAERAALDEQLHEQRQYYIKESERLRYRVNHSAKLIGTLQKQRRLAGKRHGIVRRDHERAQTIRRNGFLSERELDRLEIAVVDSALDIESNQFRIDELEAERRDAELQLAQLDHLQRTRMLEIAGEAGRIDQRLVAIRAGLGQALAAPVDGRVSALHVVKGQHVTPDTLVLSLTPADARFHAELFIPGRSIGQLQQQARVELRFDAFPFEKFGTYGATVDQVARSLLLPGDARVPLPITEPVYRARAVLDQQHVGFDDSRRALTAGMTFHADIRLSERSLFEWMMAPVIAAHKRL